MGFFCTLEERIKKVDSLLCVGLDPHLEDLPSASALDAYEYCAPLITATADIVAAYKPNIAFFEALGPEGLQALKKVIAEIPQEIPVILDAKRGDIASTASAYALAIFDIYGADAVTINPYLGYDSITPFLENAMHGVFLLCKTSNPGSSDIQDLKVIANYEGMGCLKQNRVFERLACLARDWNKKDNLGLVVGATHPQALESVREIAPDLWILAPGVGAQGGQLEAALKAGLRKDGMGMILPVSRTISRAENPRQQALQIRDEINRHRSKILSNRARESYEKPILIESQAIVADQLLEVGCIKFGDFTLKSGLRSPIYLDLRLLVGFPDLLCEVADMYLSLLEGLVFDRLAALPYAALPIATAISLRSGLPLVYARKERKTYGTGSIIEGPFVEGEQVVVIDDLVTTGESKFESITQLKAAGLRVEDIVVLIDRQSGAAKNLADKGYRMHALFSLNQLLDYWDEKSKVPAQTIRAVREFLDKSTV